MWIIGGCELDTDNEWRFERIDGNLYRFSRHRHMIDHQAQVEAASLLW